MAEDNEQFMTHMRDLEQEEMELLDKDPTLLHERFVERNPENSDRKTRANGHKKSKRKGRSNKVVRSLFILLHDPEHKGAETHSSAHTHNFLPLSLSLSRSRALSLSLEPMDLSLTLSLLSGCLSLYEHRIY